jgi:hypothetical protein
MIVCGMVAPADGTGQEDGRAFGLDTFGIIGRLADDPDVCDCFVAG